MKLLMIISLALVQRSRAWVEVSSDEYIMKSAQEKNEIIWGNCMEDTSSSEWFSAFEVAGLLLEEMCPTIRGKGDELPWEDGLFYHGWRHKYIHTVGTVAQIEWRNLGGHSYTGLFAETAMGYVRLSLAAQPDSSALNTKPGLGLKLLRDGIDSANLVAMFGVNGQESWNFFANDFTNHIGPGDLSLLPGEIKFSEATNYISEVALSDFATYNQAGDRISNPNFPFMLRFHPTGEFMFSDEYVRPFTEDLLSIPMGSTLYEIWALDQPVELGGTEQHIGDLVMTSDMVTSLWGDKHLFFRHQDMADDVAIHPIWENFLDKFGVPTSGCPMEKRNMKPGRLGDNF